MSQKSLIREISGQVTQMVFLAYLTVLRLIESVGAEMSINS